MAEKLHRLTCPGCGAPISKEELRKGYVCRFCGSEFYTDTNLEEDYTPPVFNNIYKDHTTYNAPVSQKSNNILIIGIMLAVVGAIGLLSILMVLSPTTDERQSQLEESLIVPAMLSAIPKAEFAGKAIAYHGLEYYFEPNVSVSEDSLLFEFTIRNWNENPHLIRYKPNTFIVYDDLGNRYPLHLGRCDSDLPYLDRQIEIKYKEMMTFSSNSSWCSRENYIPTFSGKIPSDANKLYFLIEKFGNLNDITIVFDL